MQYDPKQPNQNYEEQNKGRPNKPKFTMKKKTLQTRIKVMYNKPTVKVQVDG